MPDRKTDTKAHIGTGRACEILGIKRSTIECHRNFHGHFYGVEPFRSANGRLRWPREEVIKLALKRQGHTESLFKALSGIAEWFGEQRIFSDDERVEIMYLTLQALEEGYR
jgi:hypothetical protein